MTSAPLLVELHTEELPPKALRRLGDAFADGIAAGLRSRRLAAASSHQAFATPRRLAVRVDDVLARAPDRDVELKGPSVKVGLEADGSPSQALRKWAERQNVAIDSLERRGEGKQEAFFARTRIVGERLADALQEILEETIARLPIPKLMQYQLADGHTSVSFVRPAHRLVVLHGQDVVPATLLGMASGRETFGHRFMSDGPLVIASADGYESRLESAHVIASFDARRQRIDQALRAQAAQAGASLGDEADIDPLLDEVTALVEWPQVYMGEFEAEFLAVPQECLILTMRTNQKYFPLFGADGKLENRFLIVSNMVVADPTQIIEGNQRVVRPRLADARFFYEQDRKLSLAERVPQLESVVYHARLGTMAERANRIRSIARDIATRIGADAKLAERAATLAKCDLLTGMVGEFPELQGVMGRYYAWHDGEPDGVVDAMAEQYRPRFAGDDLPASETGTVLALADKLETLAGLFSIGQSPSGDKDPFALRRHALGVIRILIERHLDLPLPELIGFAFKAFDKADPDARGELETFFHDRLLGYLRDQGFDSAQITAVVALRPAQLAAVPARLAAVRAFAGLPEAQALAAANKRIGNILRKAGGAIGAIIDHSLLSEPAERELADSVESLGPQIEAAMSRQDFTRAMTLMAGTRATVDRFFDDVMVMADDERVRNNRLALLAHLHRLMNRVADISRLAAT
ncbi:MAG: glycine--tRNA ligase subunit beta [Burkholderiaceae bacterium]